MGLELPELPPPPDETDEQPPRKTQKKRRNANRTGRISHNSNATIINIEVPNPGLEGVPVDQLEIVETFSYQKIVRTESPFTIVNATFNTYRKKDCLEEFPPANVPEIFADSIFDVSAVAGFACDKYQFHIPSYRQHQILGNAGIFVDRGNLTRILHQAGALQKPIHKALGLSVLESAVLTADETPTPAGRKKGKMDKGYFWVFLGDKREVYYLFSPSRAQLVLDDYLKTFQGTLLCDGYIVYETFTKSKEGIILVQCWSHTRREFLKAEN